MPITACQSAPKFCTPNDKLAAFGDERPAERLGEVEAGQGARSGLTKSGGEQAPAAAPEVLAPVAAAASGFETDRRRMNPGEPNNPRGELGGGIDKSVLAISEPRRIRDKVHRKFVSAQACLICGRQPSDAHHLRSAQPRALGQSER